MKKALTILMAVMLVLSMFAGCSSGTTTPATQTTETTQTTQSTAEAAAPAAEPAAAEPAAAPTAEPAAEASAAPDNSPAPEAAAETAPAQQPADAEEEPVVAEEAPSVEKLDYSLPLYEEPFELSWFWTNNGASDSKEKQNLPFWNQLEEELNVSITWIQPGSMMATEQYNLMISSGDWTDLIWHSGVASAGYTSAYPGGYDTAIDDGVYLALNEYITDYAPNYYYYLMTNPDILRAVTTDLGNWYGFSQIEDEALGITQGTYIREDLWEATGLDMPTTTSGWMELLEALKANGVEYPLFVSNTGSSALITAAYGTSLASGFKIDTETDTLVYDAASEEFRGYIEWFIEAFKRGYISDSFISDDVNDGARNNLMNGVCATYTSMWSFDSVAERMMGIKIKACDVVTLDDMDQPMIYNAQSLTDRVTNFSECAVTATVTDIESLIHFLDFFYSDTGSRIANYGFNEGESYEYVDGEIRLLPEMIEVDRSNGLTGVIKYTFDGGPFYEIANRRVIVENEASQNNIKIWSNINTEGVRYASLPTLTFNSRENDAISSVGADLSTEVEAQMLKWMTGAEELTDESWAAYISYLEALGMDTYSEAYNSAYERYKTRDERSLGA